MLRIENVTAKSNTLVARLDINHDLQKYFHSDLFLAEFDFDIEAIPPALLVVPVVNNLIQVAWAVGVDLAVEVMDGAHFRSCHRLKQVFQEWYPGLSFRSEIRPAEIVDTKVGGSGTAMLYSGGVDSVVTYIRHEPERPTSIIVDLEPAGIHPDIIEHAMRQAGGAHVVRSNLYSFLNRRQLDKDFGSHIEGSWWGGVQHGMGLLGLAAPISSVRRTDHVLIAATHTKAFQIPWGSDPDIDNNVAWADVTCCHDGYELNRQQKLNDVIGSFIANTGHYPLLMVCNSYARKRGHYNCCKCAKCAQAIVGMLIAGIDPRQCGFGLSEKTLPWIKESLDTMAFFARKSDYRMWEDAFNSIPDDLSKIEEVVPGARAFIEWFRGLEFTYDDYFNKTCVMRDRPEYAVVVRDGEAELHAS